MILVDTAVWIDHLHRGEPSLVAMLQRNRVCTHPLVVMELALGRLAHRADVLDNLRRLPRALTATDAEMFAFIETRELAGRGLSAVDAHLLASAVLTPHARLWTRDKRLHDRAHALGVAWQPSD